MFTRLFTSLTIILIFTSLSFAQQTDEEFLAAGNNHLSQGRYAEAVTMFSECLRVTKIAAHG